MIVLLGRLPQTVADYSIISVLLYYINEFFLMFNQHLSFHNNYISYTNIVVFNNDLIDSTVCVLSRQVRPRAR